MSADEDTAAKTLNDFSTRLIATIGPNGSREGCLVSEAIRQFNSDWSVGLDYYMKKLGCSTFFALIDKLAGKVRKFQDNQRQWRIAVVKTDTNNEVMQLIDVTLSRGGGKNRWNRAYIPLKNEQRYKDMQQHRFSLNLNWQQSSSAIQRNKFSSSYSGSSAQMGFGKTQRPPLASTQPSSTLAQMSLGKTQRPPLDSTQPSSTLAQMSLGKTQGNSSGNGQSTSNESEGRRLFYNEQTNHYMTRAFANQLNSIRAQNQKEVGGQTQFYRYTTQQICNVNNALVNQGNAIIDENCDSRPFSASSSEELTNTFAALNIREIELEEALAAKLVDVQDEFL